ncbi:hypothetical protein BC830DRAFT_1162780 [Chytriomyces sp. MP71]|nr:hypothetical protein BC830DRAFT_1162780 [Chytriomyces sp. MP71]
MDIDWCMCGKKTVPSGLYCSTHCRIKDAGYPTHPTHPTHTHTASPSSYNLSYLAEVRVPLVALKRTTSLVKDLCQLSFENVTSMSEPDYFDPLSFLEESRLLRRIVPTLAARCSFTSSMSEKRGLEESPFVEFDFKSCSAASDEVPVLEFKRRKLAKHA